MNVKEVSIVQNNGIKSIIIDLGDGYRIRGTRATIGTFDLVVVDWEHPNYGYFADGMLWIRSMNMCEWEAYVVVKHFEEYTTLDKFLKDFPQLGGLFEPTNFAENILRTALEDFDISEML
jgi:hypothetical protein